MKKLMFALCLLLTLSACGQVSPSPEIPAPPTAVDDTSVPEQPAQPEEPSEQTPAPSTETEDAPVDAEQPEEPADSLPPLPQPVYTYGSTAVNDQGQVILETPDYHLHVLTDAATGKARVIARTDDNGLVSQLYDRNGQLLLDDLSTDNCGVLGDLFWYQSQDAYHVLRLSDGSIVYQDLALALPVDGLLAVQPMPWMTRCTMLDGSGEIVRELEPGSHLKNIFQSDGKTYLLLEDRFGKQTVATPEGKPYFDFVYDEVISVAGTYAQVRNGETWMVLDFNSGKSVCSRTSPFYLLPGSILAQTGSRGEWQLLNFQGKLLYSTPLMNPTPLGEHLLAAARPIDDIYTTVLLDEQGKELLALPTEAPFLTSLTPELLFYSVFGDDQGQYQKGILRDMTTGEETLLLEGKYLKAELVETTDGELIFCRGVSQEGAPISHLFTLEGKEVLSDVTVLDYHGGDVFETEQGLICLDGTWLYQA